MDPNGSRFFSVASRSQYQLDEGADYAAESGALRLASLHVEAAIPTTTGWRNDYPSVCSDGMGGYAYAYFNSGNDKVMATGLDQPPVSLLQLASADGPAPHSGRYILDLAVSAEGVLYMAERETRCVVLHDLRGRFARVWLPLPEGIPCRIAPDPRGGVWVLGRPISASYGPGLWLYRVTGLPRFAAQPYNADVLRPRDESPVPARCVLVAQLPPPLQDQLTAVDLACSQGGRLVVLVHDGNFAFSLLQLRPDGTWCTRLPLKERSSSRAQFYSMAWVDEHRVALLSSLHREALAYEVPPADSVPPQAQPLLACSDYYPLLIDPQAGVGLGRFVRSLDLPPQVWSGSFTETTGPIVQTLVRMPVSSFATHAVVPLAAPLDSGEGQATWHRLYLDASVPAGCGIAFLLAATNRDEAPLAEDDDAWHPHYVGTIPEAAVVGDPALYPRAVRHSAASEIPLHAGQIPRDRAPADAGLYSVLIQRVRCPVRALRGRYLWIRVVLYGSGCNTPELYAFRAYAPRFSYRDRYLPELYWEAADGHDANAVSRQPVPSTPADFLERFLCLFEGVLTPLEDQVASAHLLTSPARVPADGLPWLASFIGFSLDDGLPLAEATRRRLLACAPDLYRWHGTLAGLRLALDVVTEGAVTRGDILIVENFRLRRTFATILGLRLGREDDPLLPQSIQSANSVVGDTLFLGDSQAADKDEVCALFRLDADAAAQPRDDPRSALQAVRNFYARHAHRVTILINAQVGNQYRGVLGPLISRLTPASVEASWVATTQRFLVGVASLLGIDTVPGGPTEAAPLRLNASYLGQYSTLQGGARLDPRQVRVGPVAQTAERRPAVRSDGNTTNQNGAGS